MLVLSAALVLFALTQGAPALLAGAAITTLVSGVVAVAVYDIELLRARRAHGADRAAQARSYAAMYAAHVRVMAQGFTLANNRQQLEVPAKPAGAEDAATPAGKVEQAARVARAATPVRTQRRAAGSGNLVEWDTLAGAGPEASAEKAEPAKKDEATEVKPAAKADEKAEKPAEAKPAAKTEKPAAVAEEKIKPAAKADEESKPADKADKAAEAEAAKAEEKSKPAAKAEESEESAEGAEHADAKPAAPELWKGTDAPTVVNLKAWEVRARIAEEERAAQEKAQGKAADAGQDGGSDRTSAPTKAAEADAGKESSAQERKGA
ncbi:hypothetical protein SAMN05421678_103323 [Actinopolymorpha cephalotaxi]|uniref:Uncharacterized protein n=1 Tax=Actinopolymorpha cephalotaxi TaxID=504797 RepID=A0A1I2NGJ8_9ACTN|nr:hypothetical protein SAMN05421678_103323 [Actinopolymorpha cephalotaxi]